MKKSLTNQKQKCSILHKPEGNVKLSNKDTIEREERLKLLKLRYKNELTKRKWRPWVVLAIPILLFIPIDLTYSQAFVLYIMLDNSLSWLFDG